MCGWKNNQFFSKSKFDLDEIRTKPIELKINNDQIIKLLSRIERT